MELETNREDVNIHEYLNNLNCKKKKMRTPKC